MNRLREMTPIQIIALAVATLFVCAIGGYFLVATLTTPPRPADAESALPANLDSEANRAVVKKLEAFEVPAALQTSDRLQTPDPENPSTVNPFTEQ